MVTALGGGTRAAFRISSRQLHRLPVERWTKNGQKRAPKARRFEHDNVSAVRCRGGDSLACSSSLPVIPRQWSRDSFPWRRWHIAGLGAVRWGHKR